ncbi:MAG: DNA repair protein RecN (Recombination protein N) [Halocynthiibacter sp.]|jgi:DNA repair protein RecN (Recombination protein N)
MLLSLDIRDMLIIDRLALDFQPGLNVLTGETGAGKSILLDALGFVLGWRGRADLVREGAEQGEVNAIFALEPGHPGLAILAEAGFEADASEDLILRRINSRDGRKTSWINDRRASGDVLRALSETLVELHGQHDDRGLLNPRGHRKLLDEFAGLAPKIEALRGKWRALSAAKKALLAAEAVVEAVRAEEEYLRHTVAELEALSPEAGEEASLDIRRRQMQGAARIRDDVLRALNAISPDGAEGQINDATRWLEEAADGAEGQLDAPIAALAEAMNALSDAQQGVEACLKVLAFDPMELEAVEERLFAIRGLARKHEVLPDDLADFTAGLRAKLDALDGSAKDLKALGRTVVEAEAAYLKDADALSEARRKAAKRLDKSMAAELAPLKMERAVFATEISATEPGPEGQDEIAFTVATNPGAPSGPLGKIASGGELSRFLLALKVCLTEGTTGLTMIFDEIDRGVGGATADAVGRRLAALAKDAQVLVVTHSPQVAARGAHHWQVAKSVSNGMTTSTVIPLGAEARIDEIARMLSGDTITDPARDAARVLLEV